MMAVRARRLAEKARSNPEMMDAIGGGVAMILLVLVAVHLVGCFSIEAETLIYKPGVVTSGESRDYLVEMENEGANLDGVKLK